MKELVILIPVYQLRLEPLEIMSLSSVRSHCSDYDIRFLAPEGLQLKESITQGIPYLYMPREFFEGFQGYNRLMISTFPRQISKQSLYISALRGKPVRQ